MKKILVLALMAVSASAFAARDGVSLDCSTSRDNVDYTLKARLLSIGDDKTEGTMWDVSMTVKEDSQAAAKGRAKTLEGKKNPRATKYKNYIQFKMNELTDTADFSKYYPMGCSAVLSVPNNLMTSRARTAELPMNLTCEQGGTTVTFSCELTDRD